MYGVAKRLALRQEDSPNLGPMEGSELFPSPFCLSHSRFSFCFFFFFAFALPLCELG